MNDSLSRLTRALRPWLMLAIVCALFSLHPAFLKTFWSRDYLPTIAQQAATNIILAVGLTFVILSGGIDLSVGSVLALCGVALGLTVQQGPPPFLAGLMAFPLGILVAAGAARFFVKKNASPMAVSGLFAVVTALGTTLFALVFSRAWAGGTRLEGALLAALLVGVSCGLINGLITAWGRVPPFVVTLGMFTAARGLTVYATDGNSVGNLPPRLGTLGEGWPLVAVALCVVGAGMVLQSRTQPGRFIQAIGGNEEAARYAGVNVPLYKALAYVLSGLTAGVAAIVLTAKFGVADTGAGTGAELNAIAAVVIGCTSLTGGRGSVLGSLVGALTIAVLNAGLVLVGVRDTLQGVIVGAVIVAAVMADQIRKSF